MQDEAATLASICDALQAASSANSSAAPATEATTVAPSTDATTDVQQVTGEDGQHKGAHTLEGSVGAAAVRPDLPTPEQGMPAHSTAESS